MLLIAAQLDYGSRPEMVFHSASQGQKEGYLPNVEVKQVKTGHWVQLEAPRELSDILENFANTAVEVRLST